MNINLSMDTNTLHFIHKQTLNTIFCKYIEKVDI